MWRLEKIGDKPFPQDEKYKVSFILDGALQDSQNNPSAVNPPTTTLARPENGAKFFRMLEINYEDPAPHKIMPVTSIVQWISEDGKTHETKLSTTLTNYKTP